MIIWKDSPLQTHITLSFCFFIFLEHLDIRLDLTLKWQVINEPDSLIWFPGVFYAQIFRYFYFIYADKSDLINFYLFWTTNLRKLKILVLYNVRPTESSYTKYKSNYKQINSNQIKDKDRQ